MGRIISTIKRGWKLAHHNPDGSEASVAQRAYNFASNGGGTITYRMVMLAFSVILSSLVAWIGNNALDKLDRIDMRLQSVERIGASYDIRISENARSVQEMREGQTRIWNRINDHEHRLTLMEAQKQASQPQQ